MILRAGPPNRANPPKRRVVDPAVPNVVARSFIPGVTKFVLGVGRDDVVVTASCTDEAEFVCVSIGRRVAVCVWPVEVDN